MALVSYLKLTGAKQGPVNGDCTQQGHENTVLVYGVEHNIEIPRDTHTGLPSGQRIHHPLVVTKQFDSASPRIQQACTQGEQFTDVTLEFYRITAKGLEQHYYTIRLVNAIAVSTRNFKPLTFVEENKPYHDMEQVAFTYEKIFWTYVPSGVETYDSWQERPR
jgi:type VI secretion system secreted protein Hcp